MSNIDGNEPDGTPLSCSKCGGEWQISEETKSEIIKNALNTPDGRMALLHQCRKNLELAWEEIPTMISYGILDETSADWVRTFIELERRSDALDKMSKKLEQK